MIADESRQSYFGGRAMKTNDPIEEALSLPMAERVSVVDSSLQTSNRPDDAQAATWFSLARRRLDELRSGKVPAVPGEDVFERIRSRFGV